MNIQKYLYDDGVKTVVAVFTAKMPHLILYEKRNAAWAETLRCRARIGVNGAGKTREGDGKTPLGDFGIVCAFGIRENPGTALPYVRVTENTYCCGDRAHYNRIIDLSAHPHRCSGERMLDYSPEYDYGIFPDYNALGDPERGFGIFLHCFGEKPYTAGCVAVPKENMVKLLRACDENTRVIIE